MKIITVSDQELPEIKPRTSNNGTYLVAVKINSVYPGTKYDDTCISEITHSDYIPVTASQNELKAVVDYYNAFPHQFIIEAEFPKFTIINNGDNYVIEEEIVCGEYLSTVDLNNQYLLLRSEGGDGFTNFHFKLLERKNSASVVLIKRVNHTIYLFLTVG